MAALDITSVRAKVDRAMEHLQSLDRQVMAWHNPRPFRTEQRSSADFTRHALVFRIRKAPDLTRWSLLASDAIHNLRCALDHLVYAIATAKGAIPEKEARRLAFPICSSAAAFADQRSRISYLSDAVQRGIEALQPYNAPAPASPNAPPPPLAVLRDLDDRNKHRLLQVVLFHMKEGNVSGLPLGAGETVEVTIHTSVVVDGTEMVVVTTPEPQPNLHFTYHVTIVIALPDQDVGGAEVKHFPVIRMLETVGAAVSGACDRLSELA